MIRKPQPDWHRRDEGTAVRTAAAVATGTAYVARRGWYAARSLVYLFSMIIGGLVAVAGVLTSGDKRHFTPEHAEALVKHMAAEQAKTLRPWPHAD
ncbi:MAG: hypothetical protein H0V72_03175 [Bradyrhizobium sp.]|nr:hypothetical protein [Bradyrhizobium sp.]